MALALIMAAAAARAKALSVPDAVAAAVFAAAPLVLVAGVLGSASPVIAGILEAYGLMIFAAPLMLAASIWAIIHGQSRNHRAALNLGLVAFAGETLYLYFQTFGELLDTAAFFLAGGMLLVALAAILYALHRRMARQTRAEAAP